MKENVNKVNKDLDGVKVVMIQMLEKSNISKLSKKLPLLAERMLKTPREDILIAGGFRLSKASQSTEMYSWKKNAWFVVPLMNEEHK